FHIACLVAREFRSPPFCAGLREAKVATSLVAVPKAAVNENHSALSGENQIGISRQPPVMEPVAESGCPERAAHNQFRQCVLATDTGHVLRAGQRFSLAL